MVVELLNHYRFDNKSFSIKILFDKRSNILLNSLCRPPSGFKESFEKFLKKAYDKAKLSKEKFYIADHFNLNLLDYKTYINMK